MTGNDHVLIQNTHGTGAFVQIDKEGNDLQVICEATGKVISADIDLRRIDKKGWHHIVVTCNNVYNRGQGAIKFYVDGEQTRFDSQEGICIQPIGYVGNSKDGSCPFGTFADLRVYPYCLKTNQIASMSNYHEDLEFDMPDKYLSYFIEIGIVKLILDDLNSYARANTVCNLLKILTYLSTHRDCRAYILKYNGLEKAMDYIHDTQEAIVFDALRLVANLS